MPGETDAAKQRPLHPALQPALPLPPSADQLDDWFSVAPSVRFFGDCTYVEPAHRSRRERHLCVENSVGNVLMQDLGEIWAGTEYQLLRDRIHGEPLDACHRCCNMSA